MPTATSSRSRPFARAAEAIKPTDFALVYAMERVDRIQLVKRGILASYVLAIARSVGLPKEYLIEMLGLPRATVDRKARATQVLTVAQSELVLGCAKLIGQVQVMVEQSGDPAGFNAAEWLGEWLERPQPALGGKRPAQYLDTNEGQQLLATLLARAQSGAYS